MYIRRFLAILLVIFSKSFLAEASSYPGDGFGGDDFDFGLNDGRDGMISWPRLPDDRWSREPSPSPDRGNEHSDLPIPIGDTPLSDMTIIRDERTNERITIKWNALGHIVEDSLSDFSNPKNSLPNVLSSRVNYSLSNGLVFLHAVFENKSDRDLLIRFDNILPRVDYVIKTLNIQVGIDWNVVADARWNFLPDYHIFKASQPESEEKKQVLLSYDNYEVYSRAYSIEEHEYASPRISGEILKVNDYFEIPAKRSILIKWFLKSDRGISIPDRFLDKDDIPEPCTIDYEVLPHWRNHSNLAGFNFLDRCFNYTLRAPSYTPYQLMVLRSIRGSEERDSLEEELDRDHMDDRDLFRNRGAISTSLWREPMDFEDDFRRQPPLSEADLRRYREAAEMRKRKYWDRIIKLDSLESAQIVLNGDITFTVPGWIPRVRSSTFKNFVARKIGRAR